jgi:acyl carrier protein
LADQLISVPDDLQEAAVLELVRSHVAAVLGHGSPDAVDARRTFKELGLDSRGAVELRDRLAKASDLELPVTLAFDHPTPAAVATYLRTRLAGDDGQRALLDEQLDKLEAMVSSLAADEEALERVKPELQSFISRLQRFLADGSSATSSEGEADNDPDLELASNEELFDLIDRDL